MKDWKDELDDFFSDTEHKQQDDAAKLAQSKQEAADFLTQRVAPAFEEVKAQLEKHGREVVTSIGSERAHMTVRFQGHEELDYTVVCRIGPEYARAHPEIRGYLEDGQRYRGEGFFRSGAQDYGCKDLTTDDIIGNLLQHYKQNMESQRRQQNRP